MSDLNPREQNIIDSYKTRLQDADALETDSILTEIENSPQYNDPSHGDHRAYLNAIPEALSRKLTLQGDDPHRGTKGLEGALDHQQFTHDPFHQDPEPDDSLDEQGYERERTNAQNYLTQLQKNEVPNIPEGERDLHIEAAQKTIIDIDVNHNNAVQARDTELERRDTQESAWSDEKTARAAEMKADFMAVRLKNVLPDDRPTVQKLADQEWSRLATDYGF